MSDTFVLSRALLPVVGVNEILFPYLFLRSFVSSDKWLCCIAFVTNEMHVRQPKTFPMHDSYN